MSWYRHCTVCNQFSHPQRLCDGESPDGVLCARRLCCECTVPDGDKDYCPLHEHQATTWTAPRLTPRVDVRLEAGLTPFAALLWRLHQEAQW